MELLEPRFTTPSCAQTMSQELVIGKGGSSYPSRHSFSFDDPSPPNSNISNLSTASNELGKELIRSKKKRGRRPTTIDDINMAAERQMQRVMENTPLISDVSVLLQSPTKSASNQTVITSHQKASQEESSNPLVAAETPPAKAVSPGPSRKFGKRRRSPKVPSIPMSYDKRKSVPIRRPEPSVKTAAQPVEYVGVASAPTRKRTRLNFNTERARSPIPKPPKHSILFEISSNSRDKSNSGSRQGKPIKKTTPNKTTPNKTKKIDQFFNSVKKNINGAENKSVIKEIVSTEGASSQEVETLRNRCQELEQTCKDMDSQLKAVSNNQTIMHTNLRAALGRKGNEIEEIKKSNVKDKEKTRKIIETLVRSNSSREAKELRQQLASDGARLGRIIYTRAGMRVVENWEEGHAPKQLQRRKYTLEGKKKMFLSRQRKLEDAASVHSDGKDDKALGNGAFLSDPLTVLETRETIRYHLDCIKQEEGDLRDEEIALNNEKAQHIRALKLVASEDASRVRARPKLNKRYVPLSLLGKGGFSEVWRAYDLDELREVAVKIHQLDTRWSESRIDSYTKHVSREYEIHRDVRHPRIVSLYDVFEIDNNSFATVLECCKGTDLDSLLKQKKRLPERDARAILLQILSGMNYLSHPSGKRQGIIHYDLKPGNILFDEFGDAKITDFGLSKILDGQEPGDSMELTSQGAGTYWYLPPECFVTDGTPRISSKVDVWSIGVIFFQMLYGKRPFGDGMTQDRVLSDNTMLNARDVVFPDSPSVSASAGCKHFIQKCLTYNSALRPSISQLCTNSYILQGM